MLFLVVCELPLAIVFGVLIGWDWVYYLSALVRLSVILGLIPGVRYVFIALTCFLLLPYGCYLQCKYKRDIANKGRPKKKEMSEDWASRRQQKNYADKTELISQNVNPKTGRPDYNSEAKPALV